MDERAALRRFDKIEAEISRLKSNYRPPVRMGGGGGGGGEARLFEYASVDDMVANTPGYKVKAGDFAKASIGECNEYSYFECISPTKPNPLWELINEYVVDTKAEMDARTWKNGDRIRIAQDPKDQFLVIDGIAVSQKRMATWESYDGE